MTRERTNDRGAGARVALAFGVAALALASHELASSCARSSASEAIVAQPIAFDHARHAKENLACEDCHAEVSKGPYATFPSLQKCLLCHKEAQGTHPDEPKLRELAGKNEEVAWITVNRLPGHVYFSHAAHVRFAKLECAQCHGDMSQSTAPPARSQVEHLTMERCMECHTERGASNDCLACHK